MNGFLGSMIPVAAGMTNFGLPNDPSSSAINCSVEVPSTGRHDITLVNGVDQRVCVMFGDSWDFGGVNGYCNAWRNVNDTLKRCLVRNDAGTLVTTGFMFTIWKISQTA